MIQLNNIPNVFDISDTSNILTILLGLLPSDKWREQAGVPMHPSYPVK